MEKLEFTQDELKYLMASINHLSKTGQIQTGDILILAPIVQKLKDKIKVEEAEPNNKPVEGEVVESKN